MIRVPRHKQLLPAIVPTKSPPTVNTSSQAVLSRFKRLPERIVQAVRGRTRPKLLERRLARDAKPIIAGMESNERGLFIDCGSNVGQGFTLFERHYPLDRFDYILIEPNPHCIPHLRTLISQRNAGDRIQLREAAASTREQTLRFFGINDGDRDELSQGASTNRSHNSALYTADESKAIEVAAFSLSDLIAEQARRYGTLVLKMDIEGGECDVLEHMLDHGTPRLLRRAYVEFHAQYLVEPDATRTRAREKAIVRRFREIGAPFALWI